MTEDFIKYLKANDTKSMLKMVQEGFDLNGIYNLNGDNFLMLAVLTDECEPKTIQFLIDFKANVNSRNCQGTTPLMTAAIRDRQDIVQILLKHGADVNASTLHGWTALHYAAEENNNKVINALMKRNDININIADTDARTPLLEACFQGNEKAAHELLKRHAHALIIDGMGSTALADAISSSSSKTCDIVLQYVSRKIIDSLYMDKMGHLAAETGTHHIIKSLLNNGLNPNSKDADNTTLLMKAAAVNNYSIAELLIKRKADVNCVDNHGNSALIYAASEPNKNTIKILVAGGANVDHRNKDGDDAYAIVEEIAEDYVINSAQQQRASKDYKKDQKEILALLKSKSKAKGRGRKPTTATYAEHN